jgi:hypothetical protein
MGRGEEEGEVADADVVARGARIKETLDAFRPLDTTKLMWEKAKVLTRRNRGVVLKSQSCRVAKTDRLKRDRQASPEFTIYRLHYGTTVHLQYLDNCNDLGH